jgi:RHS repeat-associated protein
VTEERANGTTVVTGPDSTVTTLTETRDPRFGMQAPVASQFTVRMPSGLQLSGSSSRRATLANPTDPLSLTSQLDSLTVNGRTFTSVFDAAARTLTQTSAEGRQSVTQVDTLGRVVEERVAGVAPVRYGYGPRGFLTTVTQAGRVLRYDYDSTGRVKKVTDPLGRFEQYAYDSVGRVVKQTLFNGREILYGYDANSNLTSLTPPDRPAHTFAYTASNLDSVYSPPPAGLPVSATRYTFNVDGQLTRVLRPDSLAIDVAYDTTGRPSRLTLPNGQVQFAYSPTTGNLTTLTAPDGGTLGYTYNGALPKTVTWGGAVQGSVGFAYDADFRVSKIAVNGADSIAFGYDRDNLLTSAGAMTLTRDPQNGRLVRTVLGSDTSTWTYDDSTGTVTHYAAKHGAMTLFDVLYTRDSLDRIVALEETVEGVTTVKAFTYDSVGRLDHVRVNGVLTSDYAYDANGNRTSLTTQAGTVTGTYDDQDRVLTYGDATYDYAANGELKAKVVGTDTTRYTYDPLGNLLNVRMPNGTVIDYIVDALNRRIGKRVNGVVVQRLVFQGGLAPAAEVDATGQVVSRFVYATHANVPDFLIRSGATYRIISDHLGSVRLVVNTATGQVAQSIDYDEFGRIIGDSDPGFQPFGFAGGLSDPASGLVRFGRRDYDPESGRWTSKDPVGVGAAGSNVYSYVGSSPIELVDPIGECPLCWIALEGAFGGAATDVLVQLVQNGWRPECIDWSRVAIGGAIGAAAGLVSELVAAAKAAQAVSRVHGPIPLPPGYTQAWEYRIPEGIGTKPVSPRYFDPKGGEWRWHEADRFHPEGHWDHNPWTEYNSPWRNVDLEGKQIPKAATGRSSVGVVPTRASGCPCP